jgi:FxsC-like protein
MPDYFFFSYARANLDDYLKKFYDDLSAAIREKTGILDKEERVGFFDKTIELGADWNTAIAEALQECPVMVSAYSPAYFNSQYCGKEWEFFRRRRALHPAAPPVIKPVIWIPLQRGKEPPEAVGSMQYYMDDKAAPHNADGLKIMRKQYNNYEAPYDSFISRLANEILDAYDIGLPKLDPLPALGGLDSAFHPSSKETGPPPEVITQPGPATPARRRSGPKFARFVFIAGDPNEFPQGGRRRDFYLDSGGVEWKPYYPDTKPLMIVASEVAGNMNIISEELPFGTNLADLVREVEQARSLVIIFVDGWTAELPNYKAALNHFDENIYLNCSVFVPWNRDDPQTAGRCDQLMTFVRDEVFPRWSRFAGLEPSIFHDKIYSVDELRVKLEATLRRLQTTLAKSVVESTPKEDIPRRIDSDIPKPILSHQSPPGGGAA